MYKIIIALIISAFLINAAMNVRADFANNLNTRTQLIDNIAK